MSNARKRILVADDEEGIRESLKLILEDEYDVDLALDGREAVEKAGSSRYDLVFLDLKMPRKGGLEALREIREAAPGLPVLVLTAYQSLEVAKEAVKFGATDYLTKPFDREQIQSVTRRTLEQ